MKQLLGAVALKSLIGKTVADASHTDFEEHKQTGNVFIYLMFEDGTVMRVGPKGFTVFKPGEYQG